MSDNNIHSPDSEQIPQSHKPKSSFAIQPTGEWLCSQLRERGISQVSTDVFMDIWAAQLHGIPYKLEKMFAGILFFSFCAKFCAVPV